MLGYIQAFRKYICKWQGLGYNTCYLPCKKDCLFFICTTRQTKSFSSIPFPHPPSSSLPPLLHMSSSIRESLISRNLTFFPFFLPILIITKPFLFHAFLSFFNSLLLQIPIHYPLFHKLQLKITI